MIYDPKKDNVSYYQPVGTPYSFRKFELTYRERARQAKKAGDRDERIRCTVEAIRLRSQREQNLVFYVHRPEYNTGRSVHCIHGRYAHLFWKEDVHILLNPDGSPCWIL